MFIFSPVLPVVGEEDDADDEEERADDAPAAAALTDAPASRLVLVHLTLHARVRALTHPDQLCLQPDEDTPSRKTKVNCWMFHALSAFSQKFAKICVFPGNFL